MDNLDSIIQDLMSKQIYSTTTEVDIAGVTYTMAITFQRKPEPVRKKVHCFKAGTTFFAILDQYEYENLMEVLTLIKNEPTFQKKLNQVSNKMSTSKGRKTLWIDIVNGVLSKKDAINPATNRKGKDPTIYQLNALDELFDELGLPTMDLDFDMGV